MNTDQWLAADCLFVFGSLMDPDVLELVSGMPVSALQVSSATVHGYRQCEVAEESYPVLVGCESSRADGLLLHGLTVDALKRILFFEGEEYSLQPINAVTDANCIQQAHYFRDTGVYTVRETMWDFEQWRRIHKPSFLKVSSEYMNLYGTMSAAEADEYWVQLTRGDGSDAPAVAV